MVAARASRMMRATARFADQWQTAWFGRPDANYRTELDAFRGGVRRPRAATPRPSS